LTCLHDQSKSGFFESRLLSSQSKQFNKFSKRPDWLEKGGFLKNHFWFDHVNRLIVYKTAASAAQLANILLHTYNYLLATETPSLHETSFEQKKTSNNF